MPISQFGEIEKKDAGPTRKCQNMPSVVIMIKVSKLKKIYFTAA